MLKIITDGLRFSIHQETKVSWTTPDHLRIQGPSRGPSPGFLDPVSPVQECNYKGIEDSLLSRKIPLPYPR